MERCTKAGFAIVLRRLQIEHIGPAHLEDEVRVRTWVSDPRRSMITRHYVLSRSGSGKPVALVRTLYVWIDLETGRPVRVPDAFLADFAPNFA
jgi:acyl-CoA thioester hydrolase